MSDNLIYGWFEEPGEVPAHNPPVETICLFCGHEISRDDVSTHSLMFVGQYAARSYFYRTHRTCAKKDETGIGVDQIVFNMIEHNGD